MILKDVIKKTTDNIFFRQVLVTGKNSQLVIMSIKKGEDIGMEIHDNVDQIIFIVKGSATTDIDKVKDEAMEGDVIFVPKGTWHNIINSGNDELKLYTVYSPPEHADGTIHKTKKDAMEAEAGEHS